MEGGVAVIIGAGPAGLTAALELVRRTRIHPIVLEAGEAFGGLARTVMFRGNRMDAGGHRFFSDSDRVLNWWLELMPLMEQPAAGTHVSYRNRRRELAGAPVAGEGNGERVMLVRPRKSRIYFERKFFDYPLTRDVLLKLGAGRGARFAASYAAARLRPRRPARTLEEFFISRFGRQLYQTFFKAYSEKVWGVPCSEISAEWGAQRVSGLSLGKAAFAIVRDRLSGVYRSNSQSAEAPQSEYFLYPKHGPGQLWEYTAELVRRGGGEILLGWRVDRLLCQEGRVRAVEAVGPAAIRRRFDVDWVCSSMPVRQLIRALTPSAPAEVLSIGEGLVYRDFIAIGLVVRRLLQTEPDGSALRDTWLYIHEPGVQMGRIQIYNNWSPYLVADPAQTFIGLEYFCYRTDSLWRMDDHELIRLAVAEAERIGMLGSADVLDGHVVRMPDSYPAYCGTYRHFEIARHYLDEIANLYPIGRNGMHRYNNQDHSMLAAMTAVDAIAGGGSDKRGLWRIEADRREPARA